jgi:hypothetical protein
MRISGIAFSQFLDHRLKEPVVSGQGHVPLIKRAVDLLYQIFRKPNRNRYTR